MDDFVVGIYREYQGKPNKLKAFTETVKTPVSARGVVR